MKQSVPKVRSFWKAHYVLPIQFILKFALDRAALYENVVRMKFALRWTKKRYSSFLW